MRLVIVLTEGRIQNLVNEMKNRGVDLTIVNEVEKVLKEKHEISYQEFLKLMSDIGIFEQIARELWFYLNR